MRIDPASHQLAYQPRARAVRPVDGDEAAAGQRAEPPPARAVPRVDWEQRFEQHSAEGRYYRADQDLPWRGRHAISLYLTTASLNYQPGEPELMGIDLYA